VATIGAEADDDGAITGDSAVKEVDAAKLDSRCAGDANDGDDDDDETGDDKSDEDSGVVGAAFSALCVGDSSAFDALVSAPNVRPLAFASASAVETATIGVCERESWCDHSPPDPEPEPELSIALSVSICEPDEPDRNDVSSSMTSSEDGDGEVDGG
jgi:hypothetical protein